MSTHRVPQGIVVPFALLSSCRCLFARTTRRIRLRSRGGVHKSKRYAVCCIVALTVLVRVMCRDRLAASPPELKPRLQQAVRELLLELEKL